MSLVHGSLECFGCVLSVFFIFVSLNFFVSLVVFSWFRRLISSQLGNFLDDSWFNPHFVLCVSDSNNFVELKSGKPDYKHRPFGELSLFVHCSLRKNRSSLWLPVIEKWQAYMLSNFSSSPPPFQEELFLQGTRLLTALSSYYLITEFRKDHLQFLEDPVHNVLPTVVARTLDGQGLRCCCPKIIVDADDYSAFSESSGNICMGVWRRVVSRELWWCHPRRSFSPSWEYKRT